MNPLKTVFTLVAASALSLADGSKFEQDRQAILQMAGEFKVAFEFRESLAIKEGYELTKPYNEEVHELVKVVKDTPEEITLQHLLVVSMKEKEPMVVKHWSQTWKYEDPYILEFDTKRKWNMKKIDPEEVKGTWSQFVTQVDDSPRYEGYGNWEHSEGRSIWVSNETPRPLPRREYTKRKDYDVVVGVNRNIVTSSGWAHEQHNAKKVKREGEPISFIAHEIGLNQYEKVEGFDFSPAEKYWDKYAKYWEDVREAWEELYAENGEVKLQHYVEDETMREVVVEAVEIAEEDNLEELPKIKETISRYLVK